MTTTPFALTIELDGDGAHPAAWRRARHAPDTLLTGRRIAEVVTAAERFGFTAASFRQSPSPAGEIRGQLDAVQQAAFAAPLTSSIGLIPAVDTVYTEPFHVATQLASIDYASSGRAGWIAVASREGAETVGRAAVTDDALLRRETDDAIEVSRRLWDSWEDDAVVKDVATGRYLDNTRLHYADFEGSTFSVKGPSIIPRPPQGQVVVAGEHGGADASNLDVVLVSGSSPDAAAAAAAEARTEGARLVWIDLEVALDARGRSAATRLEELDAYTPWARTGRLRHTGDAAELVELIARLAEVSDGVRLHPAVIDVDLEELGRSVVPALRRGIRFSSPHAGATLRETLGLPRPANRYQKVVAA